MSVIPFDPFRARHLAASGNVHTAPARPAASDSSREDEALRDQRVRADRLEQALLSALRENATNWVRAERAERLLAEQQVIGRRSVKPAVGNDGAQA